MRPICRHIYRYQAVLMRARFDENVKKDLNKGIQLVEDGERELFSKQHYQPKKCKYCFFCLYSINIILKFVKKYVSSVSKHFFLYCELVYIL